MSIGLEISDVCGRAFVDRDVANECLTALEKHGVVIYRGAHIDDQDNRGRTPLMIAAELNHAVAVDLLLARGADKSLHDKQGKSAADLTSLTALREKLAATH